MKAMFSIDYTTVMIDDFTPGDLEVLMRIKKVKNRYAQDEKFEFEDGIKDMSFIDDNDRRIIGDTEHSIGTAERLKQLKEESERYQKYYQEEKKKVEELKNGSNVVSIN